MIHIFNFASRYFFPFVLLTLIISCNREQILLKKIDGRWRIESIRFSGDNIDSTVTFKSSYLYFQKCTNPDNKIPFCDGYHQLESGERIDYVFQVRDYGRRDTPRLVAITYKTYDERIERWLGTYDIAELRSNTLVLTSKLCYRINDGPRRCNYREIRAVRE